MKPEGSLQTLIDDVALVVRNTDDEHEITKRVAKRLSALLTSDYRLPPEFTRPSNEHHVTYPLYIAPDDSWPLASVVWNEVNAHPCTDTRHGASLESTREPNASSATSNPRRPSRADPHASG